MRTSMRLAVVAGTVVLAAAPVGAQEPPVVPAVVTTAPLHNYEDAPATPDADDPAIWIDRRHPGRALIIGTAKDAGLLAYDLTGRLLQAIRPPNARQVLPTDPPTPAGLNLEADLPCADSESGETFGRFNNVDIAYDVRIGAAPAAVADVAIVSDRGCDRVRFYRIAPEHPGGPLVDVTADDVPRVFPTRYDQPSPLQPSGAAEGWRDNPLDDQNTVYGLTVAAGREAEVFVSQRERGLIRQLRVVPAPGGRLTYRVRRTFLFDTSFRLPGRKGRPYDWTPCREAAHEEPQSEGLVFDRANETLFVAFETIGLYKVPLAGKTPSFVRIGATHLVEPITSFGRSYRATPDGDEFACRYDAEGEPAPDDVVAPGTAMHAGRFLQADLEGLSVVASVPGHTLMLASSQGDSSFHLYALGRRAVSHLGSFLIAGVGETDGIHYVAKPLGPTYPLGLLVVQNGEAPEPPDTSDVNGYAFDGSTRFELVSFLDALRALGGPMR